MELILFLIAAGIIFYLYKTFQSYLSNPVVPTDIDTLQLQRQQEYIIEEKPILTEKEKLKNSEYGIIISILGKLSVADSKSCILEEKLVKSIIEDMSRDVDKPQELFLEIYRESHNDDIQELAELFANETIGQYKKRLKIVEFMFALSYADGNFSKEEEDSIINVAAILEIENDDFNNLYDSFKALNEKYTPPTKEEALNIFGLQEGFSRDELDFKYNELFSKNRQNVLDPKSLSKTYNDSDSQNLRKISDAYALLLSLSSATD